LEENAINIPNTNFTELDRLCEEFGVMGIGGTPSDLLSLMDFKDAETEAKDVDARGRIAALEQKVNQHCHIIAISQNEVSRLSTDFGHFVGEVSVL
jgi:hypothetical protein